MDKIILFSLYSICKFITILCIFSTSFLFHNDANEELSILYFMSISHSLGGLILLIASQGNKVLISLFNRVKRQQLIGLLVNIILLIIANLFFFIGLKYTNPIKAILFDFVSSIVLNIPYLLCGCGIFFNKKKKPGTFLLVIAFIVLLFTSNLSLISDEYNEVTNHTLRKILDLNDNTEIQQANILDISSVFLGNISLFLSVIIRYIQNKHAKRLKKIFKVVIDYMLYRYLLALLLLYHYI